MAQTNFSSILDAPATDSVRPPPFPAGQYISVIKGLPRRGKSDKKQTDFIEYTVVPLQPVDGTVDEDELKEFGGLKGKELKLTFYLTEKSAYRHREFLENDLELEMSDMSHWQAAQQTNGCQFIVTVRQKPTEDGKHMFSEIASTAPAE